MNDQQQTWPQGAMFAPGSEIDYGNFAAARENRFEEAWLKHLSAPDATSGCLQKWGTLSFFSPFDLQFWGIPHFW